MTFRKDGAAYRIAGTNAWYAAYLGSDAPTGNRDRLKRELDRLAEMESLDSGKPVGTKGGPAPP